MLDVGIAKSLQFIMNNSLFRSLFQFLVLGVLLVANSAVFAAIQVSVTPQTPTVNEGDDPVSLTLSATGATGVVNYTLTAKPPTADTSLLSGTVFSGTAPVVAFNTPPSVTTDTTYTYTVTGEDTGGATDSVDITITVKNLTITATGDAAPTSVDEGGKTSTLTVAASGGTGSYTYSWAAKAGAPADALLMLDKTDVAEVTFTSPASVTVDTTYTYEVTVTDTSNNTEVVDVSVDVKDLTISATGNANPTSVDEGGKTSTLTVAASGGTGGYTYGWAAKADAPAGALSLLDKTDVAEVTFTSPASVTADTTYNYEVTVKDSSNNEKVVDVSVVVKNLTITATGSATPTSVDEGGKASTLKVTASGGTGGYTYSWAAKTGAPAGALGLLDKANVAEVTFTSPASVTADTTYNYEVTVKDSSNNEKVVDVSVTVKNVPQNPVAKITAPAEVDEDASVTLDGSTSNDPDGTIASYTWTSLDDPDIVLAKVSKPVFTAPRVGKDTDFRFALEVVDNSGLKGTDEVTITVKNSKNDSPEAAIKPFNEPVEPGAEFSLDGSISTDPDGNDTIKTYKWTQRQKSPESPRDRLRVVIVEGDSAVGRFKAPAIDQKSVQLTLILEVTDEDGLSSTTEQVVTVTLDKDLKQPQAEAGKDDIAVSGKIVTLDGSKSRDTNEDGSITSYEWKQVSGVLVTLTDADKAQASFTAPAGVQELEFELKVTDNDNLFATDTVSVFVGPKTSLQVDAGQDQIDVEEGSTVTLSGSVLNGTGTEQKLRWRQADATGTSVIFSDIDKANVHFVTPPVNGGKDAMTLTFEFVSWDSSKGVGIDSVDITVKDNGVVNMPDEFVPVLAAIDGVAGVGFDIQSGNLIRLNPRKAPLNERATQKNRPKSIPYGLFDFSLKVENPGDSVTLRVWFPEDMSSGYDWFKYDSKTETWTPYENVVFQGNEALITLKDGGPGDDDGEENGIIRDPSGPGSKVATTKTKIEGSSGGGAMIWALTLLVAGVGVRRRSARKAA